ncbi:MAG: hypothetical protein ACYDHE_22345 [Candidatus Acidiferrales bacterium]
MPVLTLASIGVYGVLSYSVTQRTSEISIRLALDLALGAQSQLVLKAVLRQGLLLASAGVLVGPLIALPVTILGSTLLYGVSVWNSLTYVAISLILMAVAFLAGYVPARRAARIGPLVALRFE